MRDKFALASVFTVAFLTGCIRPAEPVANMNGMAAPDFELARLDGKQVRLSDFKGKPVLLAFWAYG